MFKNSPHRFVVTICFNNQAQPPKQRHHLILIISYCHCTTYHSLLCTHHSSSHIERMTNSTRNSGPIASLPLNKCTLVQSQSNKNHVNGGTSPTFTQIICNSSSTVFFVFLCSQLVVPLWMLLLRNS